MGDVLAIEAVEAYLQDRLAEPDISVTKMRRPAVGFSRETWFVTFADGRRLLLRTDLPGGLSACPTSLRLEYELYRRLESTRVPVARALWYEDDLDRFGRELYVREFVDGTAEPEGFSDPAPRFDDVRIEASREHARKMALVHQVDWGSLGLGDLLVAPPDAASAALATVDRLHGLYEGCRLEPLPIVEEGLAWMRSIAPRTSPGVALCKGSNGAMQEIWRDGEIVAMSDWELASLGDPSNDWARCQGYVPTIPGRWDEDRLLDYYEEVSGLRIERKAMAFYRLVYRVEMLIVGLHAIGPVVSGALPDVRLAGLARAVVGGQRALAEAMGIVGSSPLVPAW
jgi:aminoglycoside phosphotransferase (APT) family kinase protein